MDSSAAEGRGYGKVILVGEHAVVYGRPAIAAALAIGCRARAETAAEDVLSVAPWGVTVYAARSENDPDRELLRRAFAVVCERCRSERQGVHVRAEMEIPGGAGLGGSAALSVAVIRAIDGLLEVSRDPEAMVDMSLAWERVFHGNPSGIDSAMAVRGGFAWYVRGQASRPLRAARPLNLVVANSGEHGSTKAMVESVARQHARDPHKAEQCFDAITAIANNAKSALEEGDHARLGQLMDLNHTLLNTLLLSTNTLEHMCRIARGAGALGAKLTGGGGGGCMIALAKDHASALPIERALSDAGHAAFTVEVSS